MARVDWGPFDVSCRKRPEDEAHCLCEVHYSGPARERPHLMASFWHVMEQFPFYLGRIRKATNRHRTKGETSPRRGLAL